MRVHLPRNELNKDTALNFCWEVSDGDAAKSAEEGSKVFMCTKRQWNILFMCLCSTLM